MPTFIDVHDLPGVTEEDVAKAHAQDVNVQQKHGVDYVKYWVNRRQGKVFCLCTAPNAEAAAAVHRESHGLEALRIMEVQPELADAFMGASEIDNTGAALSPEKGAGYDTAIRTIVFTDIVGSTDMTQRLGDEIALALLEVHDEIVRGALKVTSGREVKHTGDGIMASFNSAHSAVRCGMQVQKDLAQHSTRFPDRALQVRIGMAAGEPIERNNDLYGSTVQLAARLCAHAQPSQILISNAVAELCIGKALPLTDIGRVTLKGFDQPIHAHAVATDARVAWARAERNDD
jgi:class 3 adenylate cyclase